MAVAVFTTLVAFAAAAGAQVYANWKYMSAAPCHYGGTQIVHAGHILWNFDNTYSRTVTCPMMRNDTTSTQDEWDLLYVRGYDGNNNVSNSIVYAAGFVGDYDSDSYCANSSSTTTTGTGNFTLSVSAPSCSLGANSVWSLRVTLPPSDNGSYSEMYSYIFWENPL